LNKGCNLGYIEVPLEVNKPDSFLYWSWKEKMDADRFINVLPKGHEKQKVVKYFYTLCKCMDGDVEEHQDRKKHSQLLEIMDILSILQQHGIDMYATYLLLPTCCYLLAEKYALLCVDWLDKSKTKMFCFFCSKDLTVEKSNLEEHGAKHSHEI
jgi:hypothetical protein